jgi:hypothetical protein
MPALVAGMIVFAWGEQKAWRKQKSRASPAIPFGSD